MKEINLSEKINAYLVTGSEARWLISQERKQASLENFFKRYPALRDNPVYKEKWGKAINPKRGAKGGGLFPVLGLLQDGRLGCVTRTGMNHVGPGQLSISFSSDRGQTWTPYQVVADLEDDYKDKRNPAFGQAKNGDLVIVYGVDDGYGEGFQRNVDKSGKELKGTEDPLNYAPMEVIRSADKGKSWSKPQQLKYDLGGLFLQPHGQMRRLSNGALVFNARGFYERRLYEQYPRLAERATYLFWSDDDGQTWPKQTNILYNCTETGFLELDSRHWLAYCRRPSNAPSQIVHSYDGGHIWQDPVTPFPDDDPAKQTARRPGQPTLLPNGKVIITYGYRTVPFGVRVVVSHDGGKTFAMDKEYILTDSYLFPDCGYPSTVVFPDGTIVTVAYTLSDLAHEAWNTCCVAYVYKQDVFDN